ncbi:MAG: hypothetical protein J5879_03805 [Clostridia bacterium]|nr:hypothetical protein [Clostridia bacterium]
MKKIVSVMISLLLMFSAFSLTAAVSAAGIAPKLVYEPFTATVKPGERVVLTTVAQGSGLSFLWRVRTSGGEGDKIYDLSNSSEISAFEALDTKGKMKVSFKTENLEDDKVKSEVIIDDIINFTAGLGVFCKVSNKYGSVETDPAVIFMNATAPVEADVKIIADFSVRLNKLVKLYTDVTIPKSAPYTDDNILYRWYQTPDGDKTNGKLLEYEEYPILMADGYAPTAGTYYFFCQVIIIYNSKVYGYETGVTEMKVYEPKVSVSFDVESIALDDGQDLTITATAHVEPEKDKGTLTYQWYAGSSPDKVTEKIDGETSPVLKMTGANKAFKRYYTCIVNDHTEDEFDFDNSGADNPIVTVVFTGHKKVKITGQPKDAEAKEGEEVTFNVKAENVKSFNWYMYDPVKDKTTDLASGVKDTVGDLDDTITVTATPELNGCSFYCVVNNEGDAFEKSDMAKLTVIEKGVWDAPHVAGVSPDLDVAVHVGEDLTLKVDATAPEGAEIDCRWFGRPLGAGDDAWVTLTDHATLEYKPDTSKEGLFEYECTMVSKGGDKSESAYETVSFRVAVLADGSSDEATGAIGTVDTESAAPGSGSGASDTENGAIDPEVSIVTGTGSKNGVITSLIVALVLVVVVLALTLVAVGIIVLVRSGKSKKAKKQ